MTDDLRDKQEIAETCFRYASALDDRDWTTLRTCFTDDPFAHYGDLEPVRSYAELEQRIRTVLEPLDVTQHLISNVLVTLDGDEADSRCYLYSQHVRGGAQYVVGGRYVDRFVRTPEGWRIARRRFEFLWTAGDPAVLDLAVLSR